MDIQQWLAVGIAILAVVYLVRRSVLSLRSEGAGCGSCSACPEKSLNSAGLDSAGHSLPGRKKLYSIGDSRQN